MKKRQELASSPRHNETGLIGAFGFGVAFDSGEHDPAQVCFQETMGLSDGVVQFGTFFKFVSVHLGLAEEFGGGFSAFPANGIQFKDDSGGAANGQFDVSLSILHAISLARLP